MDNFFVFKNRRRAGRLLAQKLDKYKDEDVVVCAIPRGGVVIGNEVAKALNSPLEVIVTRKIGHPQNREYAICAVDENQNFIFNPNVIRTVSQSWLKEELEKGQDEARRNLQIYRGTYPSEVLENKTVILVDDGVATGLTLELAIKIIKEQNPSKIILAIPVAPTETLNKFVECVDEVISLIDAKKFLGSVGAYYHNFSKVSDSEVIELIRNARVTKNISYRI